MLELPKKSPLSCECPACCLCLETLTKYAEPIKQGRKKYWPFLTKIKEDKALMKQLKELSDLDAVIEGDDSKYEELLALIEENDKLAPKDMNVIN